MNSNEAQESTITSSRKPFFKSPMGKLAGAVIGAIIGAIIGILLSKTLWLGERVQQMNLTNTGSSPLLVKIDTRRFKGDGEVVIEAGKEGKFMYGEGDELSIFPDSQGSGKAHSVTLKRKSIEAEVNADDKDSIVFSYKCE